MIINNVPMGGKFNPLKDILIAAPPANDSDTPIFYPIADNNVNSLCSYKDDEDKDWHLELLKNCLIKFKKKVELDISAVGGGGSGARLGYGGDGGYIEEKENESFIKNQIYSVNIGQGGNWEDGVEQKNNFGVSETDESKLPYGIYFKRGEDTYIRLIKNEENTLIIGAYGGNNGKTSDSGIERSYGKGGYSPADNSGKGIGNGGNGKNGLPLKFNKNQKLFYAAGGGGGQGIYGDYTYHGHGRTYGYGGYGSKDDENNQVRWGGEGGRYVNKADNGEDSSHVATAGAENTGSGGGGGGGSGYSGSGAGIAKGAAGGSGIIILYNHRKPSTIINPIIEKIGTLLFNSTDNNYAISIDYKLIQNNDQTQIELGPIKGASTYTYKYYLNGSICFTTASDAENITEDDYVITFTNTGIANNMFQGRGNINEWDNITTQNSSNYIVGSKIIDGITNLKIGITNISIYGGPDSNLNNLGKKFNAELKDIPLS